jgi:hypothetical protein
MIAPGIDRLEHLNRMALVTFAEGTIIGYDADFLWKHRDDDDVRRYSDVKESDDESSRH